MDVRAKVVMGLVTLAAVAQEETGMEGTAPWGSQTPGRAVLPIPSAGFFSGMGGATRSATLRSVCLMAMTVKSLQPAREPGVWEGGAGRGGGGDMSALWDDGQSTGLHYKKNSGFQPRAFVRTPESSKALGLSTAPPDLL